MSSAQNHRARSRRGYRMKAAAFNNLQRSNYIQQENRRQMKDKTSFFNALLNIFTKKRMQPNKDKK